MALVLVFISSSRSTAHELYGLYRDFELDNNSNDYMGVEILLMRTNDGDTIVYQEGCGDASRLQVVQPAISDYHIGFSVISKCINSNYDYDGIINNQSMYVTTSQKFLLRGRSFWDGNINEWKRLCKQTDIKQMKPSIPFGTYGDYSYNSTSMKYAGIEIMFSYGDDFQGTIQVADGGPGTLTLFQIKEKSHGITFPLQIDGVPCTFDGTVYPCKLIGNIACSNGKSLKLALPRTTGYWKSYNLK